MSKKKFQVVVRARIGIEVVDEIPIGGFHDRLQAESLIENANHDPRASRARISLGNKHPGAIITVEMKID